MSISLIAVDIDGTLLNGNSELSIENLEAIKRLSKRGIMTVPVTGRTYNEIPQTLRSCEDIQYFVYSNGSGIYEKGRGTVYSSIVPAETAKEIFLLLNSYETYIEIYSGGYPWADVKKINEECFDYYRINPKFRKVIYRSRRPVEDFYSDIERGRLQPELFDVFFRHMGERAECNEKLKVRFPYEEVVSSMGNNLEIMNKGTDKGTGLLRLCNTIGVDVKKTIAIVDSGNDLAMFKAAGACYAVSNASNELKEISTEIICSNDEHVIEYAEKNLL